MNYKIIILVLLFCFFILLQNSFFIHLSIYGAVPNFVLILVCLVSFFSYHGNTKLDKNYYEKYDDIFLIIIAGFLTDIFSSSFFGASALYFLIIYFFIMGSVNLLRNVSEDYRIVYFVPIFIISLILYNFLSQILPYFRDSADFSFFSSVPFLLISVFYNLVFAVIGFYIFN